MNKGCPLCAKPIKYEGLNSAECWSAQSECPNGVAPELVPVTFDDEDEYAQWRSALQNLSFPFP